MPKKRSLPHAPKSSPDTYMVARVRPGRLPPRMCRNDDGYPKRAFLTRSAAVAFARLKRGKDYRSSDGRPFDAYWCKNCMNWHLGHKAFDNASKN